MTALDLADFMLGRPAGRDKRTARGPAHDDNSLSLSIAEGRVGRVLVHCRAGCARAAFLEGRRAGRRLAAQG